MRIGMEMGQVMRPEMRQVLAPRMIQSMEILQLPLMSLLDRLQTELQSNPVLELREAEEERAEVEFKGTESLPPEKVADPERDELVVDEKAGELDFDRLDAMSRDYGDFMSEEHRPSRGGLDEEGDKKHDAMQNMESRPTSLREHLEEQLPFLGSAPDVERLLRFIINNYIDRTGYVGTRVIKEKKKKEKKEPIEHREGKKERREKEDEERDELFIPVDVEDISNSYPEAVTPEQVEEALFMIQKLDPAGVGARNLRECLLLQVTEEMPHSRLVRALIQNHLEDIQHNRLMVIQHETHAELDEIKEAIAELRHLNPKPGMAFAGDSNRYIVPDIAIERRDDGTWDIRLLDDWVPEVYVSKRYLEMSRDRHADQKTREYLKRKIQDALWLKESIEQRRNTLEKVTRAIIDHQTEFLDKGPEYIQPLKMQQIADQVKVHVTTVSRAVDDKYVQTPRGVFALKRFFGGAAHNDETGEDIAWERIKQKLLEMIDREDKKNPLSDEELVDSLKAEGYPIKRRTVTKYRKMLDIPSSRQRKDWSLIAAGNGAHHAEPPTTIRLSQPDTAAADQAEPETEAGFASSQAEPELQETFE